MMEMGLIFEDFLRSDFRHCPAYQCFDFLIHKAAINLKWFKGGGIISSAMISSRLTSIYNYNASFRPTMDRFIF